MHSSPTATPYSPQSRDTSTRFTAVLCKQRRLQTIETHTTLDTASPRSPTSNWQVDWRKDWAPILVPPLPRSTVRFQLLQFWVGVVQELTDDALAITLLDQTNPQNPDEVVTISLTEIPEQDHTLLKPGAVLYWSIGYREDQGRPRERISRIRARRLPAWSEVDLERGRACAQKVMADLK